jgi:glycosyltransferase involved in cell wall biosynthesis
MRVAVFTPYLPYPPDTGGKIRSYYLLRALTERFEVDLYSVYYGEGPSEEHVRALWEHCRRVILFHLRKSWRTRDLLWRTLSPLPRAVHHFHTSQSLEQARQHLRNGRYDIVVADEMCMTPYAELAENPPRVVIRHKVDYAHYREVALARSWGPEKVLDLIEAVQLQRYGRAKMPLYQAYLACSEQDVALIQEQAPGVPSLVIPNGVDLSKFVPSGRAKSQEPILLYVGSMHYYPNIDAMLYFFEAMYQPIRRAVPDIRVQIVGHNPPPAIQQLARLPGVEVTGTVPDVWPYYDQATVFIVPLRLGSGTRLKIIEAMAMELPVVSTTIGAEGLDIRPGENILIADDAVSFVECVVQLLSDPDFCARIAKGGRLLAHRYNWMDLTKPWADLVEAVARQWNRERR